MSAELVIDGLGIELAPQRNRFTVVERKAFGRLAGAAAIDGHLVQARLMLRFHEACWRAGC